MVLLLGSCSAGLRGGWSTGTGGEQSGEGVVAVEAPAVGFGLSLGEESTDQEAVELRNQGRRRVADVRVVSDEDGVAGYYSVIVRRCSMPATSPTPPAC